MAVIIDVIIILILAISLFVGYKRGFIKTLFSTLTLLAAILLAVYFGDKAGLLIRQTTVFEKISQNVNQEISKGFTQKSEDTPIESTLLKFGVNAEKLSENYERALTSGAESAKNKFVNEITDIVMDYLSSLAGILLVFVVSLVLLKITGYVLDKIFKLPILNTANKTGGMVLGVLSGVFSAVVFCMVIDLIAPYVPENPVLYVGMEQDTYIYKYILNLNALSFFVS